MVRIASGGERDALEDSVRIFKDRCCARVQRRRALSLSRNTRHTHANGIKTHTHGGGVISGSNIL